MISASFVPLVLGLIVGAFMRFALGIKFKSTFDLGGAALISMFIATLTALSVNGMFGLTLDPLATGSLFSLSLVVSLMSRP